MRNQRHNATVGNVQRVISESHGQRQKSNELVNSLLNIRARLEDYLDLVNRRVSKTVLEDRPRPRQLRPSQSETESEYESVRIMQ